MGLPEEGVDDRNVLERRITKLSLSSLLLPSVSSSSTVTFNPIRDE
jgi:hypothetical protein